MYYSVTLFMLLVIYVTKTIGLKRIYRPAKIIVGYYLMICLMDEQDVFDNKYAV